MANSSPMIKIIIAKIFLCIKWWIIIMMVLLMIFNKQNFNNKWINNVICIIIVYKLMKYILEMKGKMTKMIIQNNKR